MRLVVLGAPGAGKGTQARNLAKHFHIDHVSTGDCLRNEVRKNTQIGIEAGKLINQGLLVPDEMVIALIKPFIESGSYILDGFPRTLSQAYELHEINMRLQMPIHRVVNVLVPDSLIVERMAGRYTCPVCNTMFHLHYFPPKKPNICDVCGGTLIQREDDKAKTVKRRLALFHEVTEPIIGYYRKQGILLEVDGVGDVQEITNQIISMLCEDEVK